MQGAIANQTETNEHAPSEERAHHEAQLAAFLQLSKMQMVNGSPAT